MYWAAIKKMVHVMNCALKKKMSINIYIYIYINDKKGFTKLQKKKKNQNAALGKKIKIKK